MMPRSVAGAAFLVLVLLAFNAWRRGGVYALKSWLSSIFLNKPLAKPAGAV